MEHIPELDIVGAGSLGQFRHVREASRAIVLRGDSLLLSHALHIDLWMIPGGGREREESPRECCVREVAEETGVTVVPERCFLILNEYYTDRKYRSYYYLCSETGASEPHPTEFEKAIGVTSEWVPLQRAAEIFASFEALRQTDSRRSGMYMREYRALSYFLDSRK